MTVRWRELLDHLQTPWSDHGRNVKHGEIVIRCPWCGDDDPSMHLGINEQTGAYNCLRNTQHRGRSPYWLLKGLGIHAQTMDGLITAFGGTIRNDTPVKPRFELPLLTRRWQSFQSAGRDRDTMAYMTRRGFTNPTQTADVFGLKVGIGNWGRRLWFPLTDLGGQVTGFTGRAIDDWRQPRYYTEAVEPGLYMPRRLTGQHRLGVLVEGPIDALKIADATQRRNNLFVAALCGLSVTATKFMQLAMIAKTVPSLAVAFDSTVWAKSADTHRLIAELRAVPALNKIIKLPMPNDIDDPGEMSGSEIEQWLANHQSRPQ